MQTAQSKRHIKVRSPQIGQEEEDAVLRVIRSGMFVSGKEVEQFEEDFAEFHDTRYAVGVNSGTSALVGSLLALGIGPGDEVIVPSMTFVATATAVLAVGATPVFADVDRDCRISLTSVQECLSERTTAVIPVHLYGHMVDMSGLYHIVGHLPHVDVIEDAAQAHGASLDDEMAGSIGDLGCFSLFATKNMCCGVEGGVITTADEGLAVFLRQWRNHGMTGRDTHQFLGGNYRMSELAAAVATEQLTKLPEMNYARDNNSRWLLSAVKDIPWLRAIEPKGNPAWFWCPVVVDEIELGSSTKELMAHLRSEGIEVAHRYWEPIYKQPVFGHLPKAAHCPNAEALSGRVIGLPNRPDMTQDELDYVAEVLHCVV